MVENIHETAMGILGMLIAPVWLWLLTMSIRSGVVWGWAGGPTRSRRPTFFWLVMAGYLALAVGFAWRGFARL